MISSLERGAPSNGRSARSTRDGARRDRQRAGGDAQERAALHPQQGRRNASADQVEIREMRRKSNCSAEIISFWIGAASSCNYKITVDYSLFLQRRLPNGS